MKKIVIPIMFIAILVALYEQSKNNANIYIECIAIVIFMYGMMRLTTKVPSKKQENLEQDDSER
jgi:Ca2+/Na+ antiporter